MLDLRFEDINFLIVGIIISTVSFFIVLFTTPKIICFLLSRGKVVEDYHKPEKPRVPRPGGPVLLIGIAIAEIGLYLLTLNIKIMAILLTTVIAFIVGAIDDRKAMPGWFKPIALIADCYPVNTYWELMELILILYLVVHLFRCYIYRLY